MLREHAFPFRQAVRIAVTLGILGAGLSSCDEHPRPSSLHMTSRNEQRITITGNDHLRFSPSVVRVHTGYVRITLVDSGAYPHNIVIPGFSFTSASVTGDPGGTKTAFTIEFRHPGRYRFYCAYHRSAGMTGVFVVS